MTVVEATTTSVNGTPLGGPGSDGAPRAFPLAARLWFAAVVLAGAALFAPYAERLQHADTRHWLTFAFLALAASVTHLFVVTTPRNQSYHTTMVFLVPAVLILPVEFVPLVAIAQHVPEWLRRGYPWYVQTFNIGNYALDMLVAALAAHAIQGALPGGEAVGFAAAGLAAATLLVALNHGVLALMLRLARGHSIRETGLFTPESLGADAALAALGTIVAAFWTTNPWLIPLALAPLFLIQRSLVVPALEEEARLDFKTGLYNAGHFSASLTDELERASRDQRPLSLLVADLDHLREINNAHGHLTGDAVLAGVAEEIRAHLRPADVAARFGGEEFSIVLRETTVREAVAVAQRIRDAVARRRFTNSGGEQIGVTISIGVASFPEDADNSYDLIHQADLALYRAKGQGRNRVVVADRELAVVMAAAAPAAEGAARRLLSAVPPPDDAGAPTAPVSPRPPHHEDTPPATPAVRFTQLGDHVRSFVLAVALGGIGLGVLGLLLGESRDVLGLCALVVAVAAGQALSLKTDDGSISVAALGALAGAAMFGGRAALLVVIASAAVEWSARRTPFYTTVFNIGTLCSAAMGAVGVYQLALHLVGEHWVLAAVGPIAGAQYFVVSAGLLAIAESLERGGSPLRLLFDRFGWLASHYAAYGFIAGVIGIAYEAVGIWAVPVFAMPLVVLRKTQQAYLVDTYKNAERLRQAAATIEAQNASLEEANRLLMMRSMAAMESLSATVDARDEYTAGHSRRVQAVALLMGRELGLSQAELTVLEQAALFHDIGKLAVPDAILLKPAALTDEEWAIMRRHSIEGERIIARLGFLERAVPIIRHHHERFDGSGYPDRLRGEQIPLLARIIHVADAFDSMLTSRVYRERMPLISVLAELRRGSGTQFCPRCVKALIRVSGGLPSENLYDSMIASTSEEPRRQVSIWR